ncbi:Protein MAIN-LIKE 2, partial [Camellia lanceoleosa]
LTLNTRFVSGTQHIFRHTAHSLGIQLIFQAHSSFSEHTAHSLGTQLLFRAHSSFFGHTAHFPGTQLVSSRSTQGYGSILAREWYTELPDVVCHIVDKAGSGLFCARISRYLASRTLMGALVERWWDTTNSFHFSATGDMTMTPYDFAMLTGLDVAGRPVPYDADMGEYTWFSGQFKGTMPETIEEIEQYARGFLMFLIGTTLLSDRGNTVELYLLSALVDLSQLWVYAYTPTLAPELEVEVPLEIPYSRRFEGQCRPRTRETLPYLRQLFDTIRPTE